MLRGNNKTPHKEQQYTNSCHGLPNVWRNKTCTEHVDE